MKKEKGFSKKQLAPSALGVCRAFAGPRREKYGLQLDPYFRTHSGSCAASNCDTLYFLFPNKLEQVLCSIFEFS